MPDAAADARRRSRSRVVGGLLVGLLLLGFGAMILIGLARSNPGLIGLGVTFAGLGLCALLLAGLAAGAARRGRDPRALSGVLLLLRLVAYAVAVGGGIVTIGLSLSTGASTGLTLVPALAILVLGLLAAVVVDALARGIQRDVRMRTDRPGDPETAPAP